MLGLNTTQSTQFIMNQILSKAGNILYTRYLDQKLPNHIRQEMNNMMVGTTSTQDKFYETQKGISKDYETNRIIKDNYATKSVQIKKLQKKNDPQIGKQPPLIKLRQKNKFVKRYAKFNDMQSESKNKSPIKQNLAKVMIQLQQPKKPSAQEVRQMKFYDGQRKRIRIQAIIEKQNESKQKQKQNLLKSQRQILEKRYQDIQSRKMKHTFDFQGKILLCSALNKNLHSKCLHTQIKVKVQDAHLKKQKIMKNLKLNQVKSNQIEISSQKVNQSQIQTSRSSRMSKFITINSTKNQIFNNNNDRQMSNLKLIQLMEGVRLTQIQNKSSIYSQKKPNLTKRQFSQKMADSKFKSFFVTLRQTYNKSQEKFVESQNLQNEQQQWNDGKQKSRNSTKIQSGTSFRTRNYKSDLYQILKKPKTSESTLRLNSDSNRPKTSFKKKQKIVIQNINIVQQLLQ